MYSIIIKDPILQPDKMTKNQSWKINNFEERHPLNTTYNLQLFTVFYRVLPGSMWGFSNKVQKQ